MPTEKSHISGLLFEQVAVRVGDPLPWGRLRVTGKEYLETLVGEAGLEVERTFVAKGYGSAGVWEGSDGGKVFDKWVEGPVGAMIGWLEDGEKRALARKMFEEEFVMRAGGDGVVREEGFYVVVGRKAPGS